jgi:hypothetical protein
LNEESAVLLEIGEVTGSETTESTGGISIRGITKIFFGICCYAVFASMYFFRPNKPVLSLGQFRFTVDSLLEVAFTVLSLPAFYLVYRYGAKTFDENPEFAVPELAIELLLICSIIWIALSNGIHLTSKLIEQVLATSGASGELASTASIHYIRQVVGHVAQHLGWQVLFATLMLGQLKRPYRGKEWGSRYIPYWGVVFGLLFTQGTIAAGCMMLGFALTVVSLVVFATLALRSRLPWREIPVLRFFQFVQITSLSSIVLYWSATALQK